MFGYEKLSMNVSELLIELAESDVVKRTCKFWIDFATRRCFIKQFTKENKLDGRCERVDNLEIFVNQTSGMVQKQRVN